MPETDPVRRGQLKQESTTPDATERHHNTGGAGTTPPGQHEIPPDKAPRHLDNTRGDTVYI